VWLWIRGGFMALGTILALAPRLRRRPRVEPDQLTSVPAPEPHAEDEPLEEVPA
jgi:hypothetical protein